MKVLLATGAMFPEPHGVPLAGENPAQILHAGVVGEYLARGWQRSRPNDALTVLPIPDGGPGSAQALRAAFAQRGQPVQECYLQAPDALGQEREIALLCLQPEAPSTAQHWFLDAGSLLAVPSDRGRAARAATEGSTAGLGVLLLRALEIVPAAATLIVGLARSAVHDGGAGLLDAFEGAQGLAEAFAGRHLELALADDTALGGLSGAGAQLAAITGIDELTAQELDRQACTSVSRLLAQLRAATGRRELLPLSVPGGAVVKTNVGTPGANAWGSGAAGGASALLQVLAQRTVNGPRLFSDLLHVSDAVTQAELVLTSAGDMYDVLAVSVPATLGLQAQAQALPTVLVAGRCMAPSGELAEAGIVSAYAVEDRLAGRRWDELSFPELCTQLEEMGARLARTWSR